MQTKQVLQRAAQFSKTTISLLQNDGQLWVKGSLPGAGIICDCEVSLTHAAGPIQVQAKALTALLKSYASIESLEVAGSELVINNDSRLAIVGVDDVGHPLLPEPTTFVQQSYYPYVLRVLASCGSGERNVVRSGEAVTEALDDVQAARVYGGAGWVGCVCADVFRRWPAGEVSVSVTEDSVIWDLQGEYRYAYLVTPNLPSSLSVTSALEQPARIEVAVDVADLKHAAKTGTSLSSMGKIVLRFGPQALLVGAWLSQADASYQGLLPYRAHKGALDSEAVVLLDGKRLQKALKPVDTPAVRLSYTGDKSFLCLASGAYVAALSPCIPDGHGVASY